MSPMADRNPYAAFLLLFKKIGGQKSKTRCDDTFTGSPYMNKKSEEEPQRRTFRSRSSLKPGRAEMNGVVFPVACCHTITSDI